MSLWAILRYVFHTDMYGMEEVVVMVAFWLYFMANSYAVYEKSHVKADILPSMLNKRHQQLIKPVLYGLMLIACIIYSIWSFDTVHFSYIEKPTTMALAIPFWIGHLSILVGFILSAFYSGVYFIQSLMEAIKTLKDKNYTSASDSNNEDAFVL
jgi:TRAP-type C4-dicarboxylate transport system permease small subunit